MSVSSVIGPGLNPAAAPPPTADHHPGSEPTARNLAVDAYRGLVMLLMMGEVLSSAYLQQAFPHSLPVRPRL